MSFEYSAKDLKQNIIKFSIKDCRLKEDISLAIQNTGCWYEYQGRDYRIKQCDTSQDGYCDALIYAKKKETIPNYHFKRLMENKLK